MIPESLNLRMDQDLGTGAISLRHYGPIEFDVGATPIRIERQDQECTTSTWADVTSDFLFAVGSSANVLEATPVSQANFLRGYRYRAVHDPAPSGNDRLRCALGLSTEPDARVYADYEFTLERCDGDVNSDELIVVNDVSFVLFRLGGDPCNGGDANGDGVVDVNDISYVLFRLGNSCGGGGAMAMMPAPTITAQDIVEEMGFRNLRHYKRFVDSLGGNAEAVVPPMVESAIEALTE